MQGIPVFLNTRAGGRRPHTADEVGALFEAAGLTAEVRTLGEHDDPTELVSRCAKEGCSAVVVGGGDGSLHAAAGALAGTDTALGILPLGTFNHFAKDLGLPIDLEQAVKVIATGSIRSVDVGEANGRVFINNASMGMYPSVVHHREGMQHRLGRGKWAAFALAVWRALMRYRLLLVRVLLKEPEAGHEAAVSRQEYVRRTPFVFVGNNSYSMDRLIVGRRDSLEGGNLSLYMARRESPMSLLPLALRALVGRLREAEDFESFRAETLQVETRHARELVGLDGEVVAMEMPLCCRR